MQRLLHLAFPPRCVSCGDLVAEDFALCGPCWRDTPFITGLTCHLCGVPLPGTGEDEPGVACDDCMALARPWRAGRAAMLYRGNGRRLVLALKHGDRTDIARPAARWLALAGAGLLQDDPLLVPVPIHRWRLLRRRYNQAALLSGALARATGCDTEPDLLTRVRATELQDGKDREARFRNLGDAIRVTPRRAGLVPGRRILLIDDVMTSGATLAASAEACLAAGAAEVSVLVLARVAKDA